MIITHKEFLSKVKNQELTDIHRMYVCSPLSAEDTQIINVNMLAARGVCGLLNRLFREYNIRAWAPHAVLPEILDDNVPEERQLALDFGIKLLELSDAIYVSGERISNGMRGELIWAFKHNLPVISETSALLEPIEEIAKHVEAGDESCLIR